MKGDIQGAFSVSGPFASLAGIPSFMLLLMASWVE